MNEVIIASIIATLAITLACLSAFSGPDLIEVTSHHVVDGDSVTLWTPKHYYTRLKGIDAPELGQLYGPMSKVMLEEVLKGKELVVEFHGKDIYNREVVTLYGKTPWGKVNINEILVEAGAAFVYRQYVGDLSSKRQVNLDKAEEEAKKYKRGVWGAYASQQRPWDYRHK